MVQLGESNAKLCVRGSQLFQQEKRIALVIDQPKKSKDVTSFQSKDKLEFTECIHNLKFTAKTNNIDRNCQTQGSKLKLKNYYSIGSL